MFSPSTMFVKKIFAHENMKKTASKVAEPAQIQPKSQFLFHKNLPPRYFSIMTLPGCLPNLKIRNNLYNKKVFVAGKSLILKPDITFIISHA